MTFSVITEAAAEREWHEAVDWYDEQEPGIGQRLNTEIHTMLQTLSTQPERFPLVGRLTRKAKILGWPYSIFFTVNGEHSEVKVIAIWHGSQSPARLRRRLK